MSDHAQHVIRLLSAEVAEWKQAAQAERERCARIAESFPQLIFTSEKHVRQVSGADIAKAIRDPVSSQKDSGK